MITPEEANIRLARAWRHAEDALMELLHGTGGTIEDYHQAVEIAVMWRMVIEGAQLSPVMHARLMEATNDLPPQSGMTHHG